MATYTSDLTSQVVNAADSASGWSELASPHSSGGTPAVDAENFYHNAASVSQGTGQASGQSAGFQYLAGSALTWTAASNWCLFFWTYYTAPTNLTSWTSGGLRVGVGDADNDAHMFNAMGVDFDLLPLACWQSTAIDPEATPDQTVGTVNSDTTYQNFAILPNVNAKITKGSPVAADVIRYGRGQLLSTGATCLFSGMATFNDDDTIGRYGMFTALGSGYRWKGLMQFGDASTTCTMDDSNVAISIEDTPRVLAGFNKIEVYNSGSSITWTSVGFTGIETSITGSAPISAGDFEVIDNATINFANCTFTDMGTFIFNGGTNDNILDGTTFRRCGQVTEGGALVTDCTFDSPDIAIDTAALVTDDLGNGAGNSFARGTNGHAVELTSIGDGTQNWDNTGTGYASGGSGGSPVTPTSVGDEMIYVSASSGTITISVSATGTIPSIRSAGATVNVVANEVDIIITATVDGVPLEGASVYMKLTSGDGGAVVANGNTNASGIYSTTYGGSTPVSLDTDVSAVRHGSGATPYEDFTLGGQITSSGYVQTALMSED